MTTSEPKKITKAGKRERIGKLLKSVVRFEEPKPVVDEQLMMLLAMKQGKK